MKEGKDMVSRFDNIRDLPVSEEMLGAYLEGNLDRMEMEHLGKTIEQDSYLSSIVCDICYDGCGSDPTDDRSPGEEHCAEISADNHTDYGQDLSALSQTDGMPANQDPYIDDFDSDPESLLDDSSFELPDIPLF